MKKGFTLIELLVVVAIIGILIALAFPVISQVRDSAKTAAARMDMQSIMTGTEEYAAEYRRLPVPDPFLGNDEDNDGSRLRRWDGREYGMGIVRKGVFEERLGIGWTKDEKHRIGIGSLKLLKIFIATLQGSNDFDLNPRKAEYLQKQEGRPTGLYMDPWSKGFTLSAHPENRQYNLMIDHNMNGIIGISALVKIPGHPKVRNHLVIARSHGPNRIAEGDITSDDFDDILSVEMEEFQAIAQGED